MLRLNGSLSTNARRFDSRQCPDAIESLPEEDPTALFGDTVHLQIERDQTESSRFETELRRTRRGHPADEKAGTHRQHQGSGDLADHQHASQERAPVFPAVRRRFPQSRHQIRSGGLDRRRETKRDPGDDRQKERERQDTTVESEIE